MPYEISFTKRFTVADPDLYINDCCWGGDVAVDMLLPAIKGQFEEVWSGQEDWGWFIWFRKGAVSLAIDIFCEDPGQGSFRIHLSSRKKRWLLPGPVIDTPELEEVRRIVSSALETWLGSPCRVVKLDADFNPEGIAP